MKKSYLILGLVLLTLAGYLFSRQISPGPQNINALNYPCEKGKSAFDLLLLKAQSVKFQDSSFGKMVTAINNTTQGNGKYWLYSINDKEATVGASEYKCTGEENIKWELK